MEKLQLLFKKANQLHQQAQELRESKEFDESLLYEKEAAVMYKQLGNLFMAAEACAGASLALRHKYKKSKREGTLDEDTRHQFLIEAGEYSNQGVNFAEESGDKTALPIPLFNYAKILAELGKYDEALEAYNKIVFDDLPLTHKRSGVIADIQCHKYAVQYRVVHKDQRAAVLEEWKGAIHELKNSDEQNFPAPNWQDYNYNYQVWYSGALLEMFKIRWETGENNSEVLTLLEEAQSMIDLDPRLIIRKDEIEDLWKLVKYSQ